MPKGLSSIERHRYLVTEFMGEYIVNLTLRSAQHDLSKKYDPERKFFSTEQVPYWSEEYKENLKGEALQHHYSANDHHPQHNKNGIDGMSLPAIIEMLCDWLAASTYHNDGHFEQALEISFERFGVGEQLQNIIINTLRELGHYPMHRVPPDE